MQDLVSNARVQRGLWWERAWGLVDGCTKVSEGCKNCWSETEAAMRLYNPIQSDRYREVVTLEGHWTGKIKLAPNKRLHLPFKRQKPTLWAVWNDLFHDDVAFSYIDRAYGVIRMCSQHRFVILTKRPQNMSAYYQYRGWYRVDGPPKRTDWPHNVWLGVTAENQDAADKRIPIVLPLPAAGIVVSIEPMLGPVDLSDYVGLDWVIVGAESGQKKRFCKPKLIQDVITQRKGRITYVPVFVKQIHIVTGGGSATGSNVGPCEGKVWTNFKLSKNLQEWPVELQVREFPI